MDKLMDDFLARGAFAVAGASSNRDKYGNKVLRAYLQNNRTVYPINPREEEVEGLRSYPDVASLPEGVEALSIVTPPSVTVSVVDAALDRGIQWLWMQPGAENLEAIEKAVASGAYVIHGGPCLLVALSYRE